MKSVIVRAKEYLKQASETEKGIIRFILSDPERASHMGTHELARVVFASPSTIGRLCRKIGFDDYREYQRALACELALREGVVIESDFEIGEQDSIETIISKTVSRSNASLEDTQSLIDSRVVEQCVGLMARADSMTFFGVGASLLVAKDAFFKFIRVKKHCQISDDFDLQLVMAKTMTPSDPACGSGGFFLTAQRYISGKYQLTRDQKEFLKNETFHGWEIVRTTYRLSLMNLFLHNIGDLYGVVPVTRNDALLADPGVRYDYVLTNPPFGRKSSMTFTNEEGDQEREDLVYNRQDFWATSSNKQLNFIQHIHTLLKSTGKAAVVVPDNVLFEGGVGEIVRKKLLETCDLHTILRLPTGIFYKPGVKANVIFFDKRPASPETQTREVWIYDFRTNIHFTLKQHPLAYEDLREFLVCYHPENRHERRETWSPENPEGRFRRYGIDEILSRDKTSLDIFWIKDKSLADLDNLPDPDVLAAEILENLEEAMESFRGIVEKLM